MPIYEYQCTHCSHLLEILQKIQDAPLKRCPACGKQKLQKLISAAAFQLKGTGWYETDFKNKPKREPATEKNANGEGAARSDKEAKSNPEGKSASAVKSDASSDKTNKDKAHKTDTTQPADKSVGKPATTKRQGDK